MSMAEVKKKSTVMLVSAESLATATNRRRGVAEVRYVRDRDEPAFNRTWERISQMKAQGQLKPIPAQPVGGVRLRGTRAKQTA